VRQTTVEIPEKKKPKQNLFHNKQKRALENGFYLYFIFSSCWSYVFSFFLISLYIELFYFLFYLTNPCTKKNVEKPKKD